MTNTIELLEAIGRDASLRHASREHLSQSLSGLQASEGLKRAAISGESDYLTKELGHSGTKMALNHSVNQNPCPGHDDGDYKDDDRNNEKDDGKDHGPE